ncbi:hypothetical protein K1720_03580 [Thermococcus argininiproducens]|uniref:Uncharacterized protein n=1 Tax=Thermococcus argininiproducens TaxID=2866384 RepID=A0A9E7MBE9_9EURY|nr:hypothetical protein [Thermococcus argininiproducens]USH00544.1 hypothetical protein K1720_03580 [Thermococcus argininiproducens]
MIRKLKWDFYLVLVLSVAFILIFSVSLGIYKDKMTKNEFWDRFIGERLAYVYVVPNESIEATIFWCPSSMKLEKDKLKDNISVTISTPLGSLVQYKGEDLQRSFRGYFRMIIPMQLLGFESGSYELENVNSYIYVTTPTRTEKFTISLGNWIIETGKEIAPKLIITENSRYATTFVNDSKLVKYEIGLFNPTNESIYIMNIFHPLDSQSLRTLAIACYNTTSILDLPKVEDGSKIPKENLLSSTGCQIPPREKRYLVMYIEVDPTVEMLLLRPKIEYKLNNSTFFMPGATMEFVRITERCTN